MRSLHLTWMFCLMLLIVAFFQANATIKNHQAKHQQILNGKAKILAAGPLFGGRTKKSQLTRTFMSRSNMRTRTLTSKIQNMICCHLNHLCFVHIFLILVCCTIATRIGNFYRAYNEEMFKSSLILILLTIINRY